MTNVSIGDRLVMGIELSTKIRSLYSISEEVFEMKKLRKLALLLVAVVTVVAISSTAVCAATVPGTTTVTPTQTQTSNILNRLSISPSVIAADPAIWMREIEVTPVVNGQPDNSETYTESYGNVMGYQTQHVITNSMVKIFIWENGQILTRTVTYTDPAGIKTTIPSSAFILGQSQYNGNEYMGRYVEVDLPFAITGGTFLYSGTANYPYYEIVANHIVFRES